MVPHRLVDDALVFGQRGLAGLHHAGGQVDALIPAVTDGGLHGPMHGVEGVVTGDPLELPELAHGLVAEVGIKRGHGTRGEQLALRPGIGGFVGHRRAGQTPDPLPPGDQGLEGLPPSGLRVPRHLAQFVDDDGVDVGALDQVREEDLHPVVVDDVDIHVPLQPFAAVLGGSVQDDVGQVGEMLPEVIGPGAFEGGQGGDDQGLVRQALTAEEVKGPCR